MTVITAQIVKGRSVEPKRRLVSALTLAVVDVLDVPIQSITVAIAEYERENWATGGELQQDRQTAEPAVDLDALFRKPAEKPAKLASKAAKAPPRKAPAKSPRRR